MKILKIFGIVVGIHVFALILIFANPGCSSSTRPAPAPVDTVSQAGPAPSITVPDSGPSSLSSITFNPDAPAVAASSTSRNDGTRFSPTRPGTPVANVLVAEPVVDVTPATTYIVKAGDSLWSVAKKHHLTIAELTGSNNLKSNAVLKPGQKLLIPGKPASPAAAATAKPGPITTKAANQAVATAAATPVKAPADSLKHVVKPGESLSVIARQYGVRSADIAVANNITDPAKVNAGTELTIPGWQTKSGKSGQKAGDGSATSTKSAPAAQPPAIPSINPEAAAPRSPNDIPVIRVEEAPSPLSPAPRNP